MLNVAIRANAGEMVGLGHVCRCLTLAEALRSQNTSINFITNPDPAAVNLIQAKGFAVIKIDPQNDLEQTVAALDELHADGLIVDSYEVKADYLTVVREHVDLLAMIDDIADRRLPVDIVINGALYADNLVYDVPPQTIRLVGGGYAILRKEFAQEPARQINESANRILITLGGGDPTGLTERLISWILQARKNVTLDVIVGPFFANQDLISGMATERPDSIRVHHNPPDMRSLMLETGIAITGGGQTTYELAATGTPAVAILTAEHQLQNLNALAEAGSLVYAGRVTDSELESRVISSLTDLMDSPTRRRIMSERGRALIDGLGAERLAKAIAQRLRTADSELAAESGVTN